MLRYRLRLLAAVAAVAFGAACSDAPSAPPAQPPVAPDAPSSLLGLNFGFRGPTYLQCPANTITATTGIVGPLGGLLSLGEYVVNIPEGAVPTPTLFQLTIPASRFMKVDVTAVGVEHYVFRQPITVTVDYSRCPASATEGKDLEVWYVSPLLNIPLDNMGGTNDAAARRITFTTDHLSGYVIAY